jgi:hypothetical protein
LPDGWCVADEPGQRANLIRAYCRRIHEVWFDLVEQASCKRELANKRAQDWNAEAQGDKDEAVYVSAKEPVD